MSFRSTERQTPLTTEEIGGYLMKKSGRWLNDAPDIQLVYAIPQDIYD
ncbi:hypothetical protein HPN98_25555 [Klebsiella pneumoniae]|nr:hypothetical protein [Klebsiella pneumoniae]